LHGVQPQEDFAGLAMPVEQAMESDAGKSRSIPASSPMTMRFTNIISDSTNIRRASQQFGYFVAQSTMFGRAQQKHYELICR